MSSRDKSPPPSTAKTTPHASSHQLPPIALIIYPITLLIGSLYSSISPTARVPDTHHHPAPLAPSIATDVNLSSPPESPVNYFARKDNIFNLYFVKIGWIWLTLAFASLLLSQPPYRRTAASSSRRLAQAGARYALATGAWYLMTQWFFGPPVIDRGFVITGGKCERIVSGVSGAAAAGAAQVDGEVAALETVLTAAACKAAGGAWTGGHDVSGHVFMLVLATGVLGLEVMGVAGSAVYKSVSLGSSSDEEDKENDGGDEGEKVQVWALRFVLGVVGLGWWMLFMTAIWFHTWLEKWSGLTLALGTLYAIYFLPRKVGSWRDIVGMPGV